jgi:hypothetical protein
MIRTDAGASLATLIARIRAKAERLARQRDDRIRETPRDTGHPWRTATQLWPDLFEDN